MKFQSYIFSFLLLIGFTGCFNEYDEGYDLIGRVATIPVLTLSQTEAVPGAAVAVTFRYYSEHEPVTELRLIQVVNGERTTVSTKAISGHNLRDSYQDSFTYTVPALSPVTVTLRVEVVTANSLANGRQANLDVVEEEEEVE
ncbi:hypothetical protein [Lunatibacter salilacus]|uniref:hypothetical protein n=1 Tax=Lunatibacter salilacus TaxID=2483804 RepID=UPI00131C7F18|nr:hypothetical protein [Lunatibacter salilacus]